MVIIFSIWDVVGILRDRWSYSPRFTTGWELIFGMPIEELVFFIVVPICGLLTYAVGAFAFGDVHHDRLLSGQVNSARTGTPRVRLSRNVTFTTST
ncbi:MAG TPA: lycopene cyclase domain-containing protein [Propionibacteriaceae bacterium]|nr:lycopene cyclase domain-containing protein [Propionibacteriaceae bacterium]